jgi:hypothetical protein
MINIILMSYKRLTQAELNTFATTVSQKMTDNVQFAPFKNYVDELKATNYQLPMPNGAVKSKLPSKTSA